MYNVVQASKPCVRPAIGKLRLRVDISSFCHPSQMKATTLCPAVALCTASRTLWWCRCQKFEPDLLPLAKIGDALSHGAFRISKASFIRFIASWSSFITLPLWKEHMLHIGISWNFQSLLENILTQGRHRTHSETTRKKKNLILTTSLETHSRCGKMDKITKGGGSMIGIFGTRSHLQTWPTPRYREIAFIVWLLRTEIEYFSKSSWHHDERPRSR